MKIFSFIFTFMAAGITVLSVHAEEKKSRFEHLIDVDYSFFGTRTKMQWGVDPFQKEPGFAKVNESEEKLELNGILYSDEEPTAIINGQNVVTGDVIGNRRVEEIGENYVILKRNGSEIELNLPPVQDPLPDEDQDDDEEKEK